MKFIYLDCETTGLDAKANGIIQIAGVIEIDGQVQEELNLRCKPFKGDIIDSKALETNQVTYAQMKGFQEPHEAYSAFKAILDKYVDKYNREDKFYAVGQNVGFDLDFLREFFAKNDDKYFGSYVHYHKVDLIAITTIMKIAGKIELENMKLETVMKVLGFGGQTHDAMDDVYAVRKIFYHYVDFIRPKLL